MSEVEREWGRWRAQAENFFDYMEREGWVAKYAFVMFGQCAMPLGMPDHGHLAMRPDNDNRERPRSA